MSYITAPGYQLIVDVNAGRSFTYFDGTCKWYSDGYDSSTGTFESVNNLTYGGECVFSKNGAMISIGVPKGQVPSTRVNYPRFIGVVHFV